MNKSIFSNFLIAKFAFSITIIMKPFYVISRFVCLWLIVVKLRRFRFKKPSDIEVSTSRATRVRIFILLLSIISFIAGIIAGHTYFVSEESTYDWARLLGY